MLTISSSEKDISVSYSNHAICYIPKPDDANDFISVVTIIKNFRISEVMLATKKDITYDKR